MLRSAALAVLAIALSSSIAAAQTTEPDLEIDIMSMLDYERDLPLDASDLIVLAEYAPPARPEESTQRLAAKTGPSIRSASIARSC